MSTLDVAAACRNVMCEHYIFFRRKKTLCAGLFDVMHKIGGIRPLKPELPFMAYWPESFRDKSELPHNGANVRISWDAVIHHTGFTPVGNTKTRSSQRRTLFVSLLEPPFVRRVIQWTCKPQVGLNKSRRANTYSTC